MNIREKNENLFSLDDKKYVMVHCISLDCKMGAGIAVQFDKRYPGMKNYLLRLIRQNNIKYPIMIPYTDSTGRVCCNLITKNKYWNKPTYETINKCIDELVLYCKENNVKYLGLPRIGCGLDKLNWIIVKQYIEKQFNNLDISIEIRYI